MCKIVWEDDFYDRHERDEWMSEHEDDLISLGDDAWLLDLKQNGYTESSRREESSYQID